VRSSSNDRRQSANESRAMQVTSVKVVVVSDIEHDRCKVVNANPTRDARDRGRRSNCLTALYVVCKVLHTVRRWQS
jgi:hypothetical protein